jgi:nucleoid DNA-binding protein
MNKTDLIKRVSKDTDVPEKETRLVINSMIDNIKDRLFYGVEIKLKDFLTFKLEKSKQTKRVNPQTKEQIIVPKKYRIKTVWSRLFVDKIQSKTVH